jgi:hypothetical protein
MEIAVSHTEQTLVSGKRIPIGGGTLLANSSPGLAGRLDTGHSGEQGVAAFGTG